MDFISLIGIAVGLSMDAFAVSVSNGALTNNIKRTQAFKLAIAFGLFQGGMPVIGWLIGKAGESIISSVDHWIAFILLSFIGGKMIYDFIKDMHENTDKQKREPLGFKAIILLAVATSIDALSTGIILPSTIGADTAIKMLLAVSIIAVTTFILSYIGVYLGKAFGTRLSGKAEIFGGCVLIAIGVKILIEHMLH